MNWTSIIAVFLGGGLGSVSRFTLSYYVVKYSQPAKLPIATLSANILACIVMIAVLAIGYKEKELTQPWQLFVLVGFCGGLSTFSTFSFENWVLLRDGYHLALLANIILSVGICLLLFFLAGKYFIEVK